LPGELNGIFEDGREPEIPVAVKAAMPFLIAESPVCWAVSVIHADIFDVIQETYAG
jgi:hypothetical protein